MGKRLTPRHLPRRTWTTRNRTTRNRVAACAGLGAVVLADVLVVQIMAAARREYATPESAPEISGEFGAPTDPTLRLAMLGDSTAAGVGVANAGTSVGGRLAALVARNGLNVHLYGFAVSGSRVGDLGPQVSRALLTRPDVAVILIGANDATHITSPHRIRPALETAIRRLRNAGVHVVLGTCPDLGAARAIARPLRDVLAAYGRHVADIEAEIGERGGAIVVDLASATGAVFRAEPQATLSSDAFHPSAAGYDLWARALLPALRRAVAIPVV